MWKLFFVARNFQSCWTRAECGKRSIVACIRLGVSTDEQNKRASSEKRRKSEKRPLSPQLPCGLRATFEYLENYEYMKIIYGNCGVNNYMKEDHHIIYATFAVAKRKPEKNSGLYGIRTLNLCQVPLRYRSLNWFVVNPWKDDDENYEYIKIIYVNCGVNSDMKEGHRSYIRILEYLGAWTGDDYLIVIGSWPGTG